MLLIILRNSFLKATKCFSKVVCCLYYRDVDEVRGHVCTGQGDLLCVCPALTFDLSSPSEAWKQQRGWQHIVDCVGLLGCCFLLFLLVSRSGGRMRLYAGIASYTQGHCCHLKSLVTQTLRGGWVHRVGDISSEHCVLTTHGYSWGATGSWAHWHYMMRRIGVDCHPPN